jgi:hypothetical protein
MSWLRSSSSELGDWPLAVAREIWSLRLAICATVVFTVEICPAICSCVDWLIDCNCA